MFPVQFRDIGYNIKLSPMCTGATLVSIASPIQGTQRINGFQYKGMYFDENSGTWILDISKFPLYYHISGFWK